MKTITKKELNETRGYKHLVTQARIEELKEMSGETLLKLSNVPDYRFDHIETGVNFLTVHDRGYQNTMATDGYGDASTTWTTQEWDKDPWE